MIYGEGLSGHAANLRLSYLVLWAFLAAFITYYIIYGEGFAGHAANLRPSYLVLWASLAAFVMYRRTTVVNLLYDHRQKSLGNEANSSRIWTTMEELWTALYACDSTLHQSCCYREDPDSI